MPNAMTFYVDHTVDVKYTLNTSAFGDGALDKQQKSIICSLVDEEVVRLTSSARLTISPTSVSLTTDKQTVEWRIQSGSSLMVTRISIVSWDDLSMSAPTSI